MSKEYNIILFCKSNVGKHMGYKRLAKLRSWYCIWGITFVIRDTDSCFILIEIYFLKPYGNQQWASALPVKTLSDLFFHHINTILQLRQHLNNINYLLHTHKTQHLQPTDNDNVLPGLGTDDSQSTYQSGDCLTSPRLTDHSTTIV